MSDEQRARALRDRINAGPGPSFRGDCRLSNLVHLGGRQRCHSPSEHRGACGVPPWAPARGPRWWHKVTAWLEGAI